MGWIETSREVAFGPLQLTHDQFYSMTPLEYHEQVEGYNWRMKDREEREANWVVTIANACGRLKRPMRVTELLGRAAGRTRQMIERVERSEQEEALAIEELKRVDNRRSIVPSRD